MIRASFVTYNDYKVDSLYQWDVDQELVISGLNIYVAPEVHFNNHIMGKAIVRQSKNVNGLIRVAIPNSLLQQPFNIIAHIGTYAEGKSFSTIEKVEIPIIPRARPEDYTIEDTDEEIYSFKALENRIANMVSHNQFNEGKEELKREINEGKEELQKEIDEGKKELQKEIDVERKRIDNLQFPETPTKDLELVDIRKGANGKTYNTAGEAVRSQINDINKEITALRNEIGSSNNKNLFDYKNPMYCRLMKSVETDTFVDVGVLSIIVPVTRPGVVTVDNKNSGDRLQLYTCTEYPKVGGKVNNSVILEGTTNTKAKIDVGEKDHYLVIYVNSEYTENLNFSALRVYYGTEWENGGGTGGGDNKPSENLFDYKKPVFSECMKNAEGDTFVDANVLSIVVQINKEGTITVDNKKAGNRLHLYTSVETPAVGVKVTNFTMLDGSDNTTASINASATDKYLTIYVNTDYTEDLDFSEMRVFYGTEWNDGNSDSGGGNTGTEGDTILDKLSEEKSFNLLSYRQLGALTKGYICLTCDDGTKELATVTIPKIKQYKTTYNRNIPVTFALMSASKIFADNGYKTSVQEACRDYGCAVAIHGVDSYTTIPDAELIKFLNEQEQFLIQNCGKAPKSIIYPNHDRDPRVCTISGSYYGVCCGGGASPKIIYGEQTNGARSNMYSLHRFSLFNANTTNERIKTLVDYAYEHNTILIPFWHDIDLSVERNAIEAERCSKLLDYCVSYAIEKGITFCTADEIPNLI